MKKNRQFSSQ
ncbi:Protein of unknown function [Leuconostoc citreum]|nr:Protein of unknown function [Leuconostoc citreum LBAE E16]CDX63959.1 Protein of unknown function [Leuconostoc citreum]CDX65675.1 Protein of unknown function [Leuconostoc citreum]